MCLCCVLLASPTGAHGTSASRPGRRPTPSADPPALALSIDDGVPDGASVGAGAEIQYTLVFTNPGASAVANVRLVATIPLHTQVISPTVTPWSCTAGHASQTTLVCSLGLASLAAAGSHAAQLPLRLDDPLPPDLTILTLEAAVTGDDVVCGECGLASIDTPVNPQADAQGRSYHIYFPTVLDRL